ncbi:MFS transporter [Gilvimarinus sp. F26214L]|uniref:MFS transporter n=1 Tax=Gilvimarinus sp. DZF01 TaxID=3461371 RepID=UPI0040458C02
MTAAIPGEAPQSGQDVHPRRASAREWWGLAVLILPTVLLALDMTVLHLAVPALSADLKPTSAQLLWILDIYGFMIAGFLITMGTLGDRIGRRKLLLAGATAFGAASAVAAFSTSAEMLIATRALLGIAGATLMPSTLSLIRNMFQVDSERTIAITVWMAGFLVGSSIGPLVGGAILEFYWWGAAFLLGVPVMVLLLISGPILLPEFRDENAGRLDFASALLSIASLLMIMYGLKDMARNGLALVPLLVIVLGAMVGLVFVRRQRTLEDPMFELGLFRNPGFSAAVVAMLFTILALSGSWLMLFQYLQGVLGLSPLEAGLVTIPSHVVQVAVALLLPRYAQRFSAERLIPAGLLLAAPGFLLLTQVGGPNSVALFILSSVIMGTGVMPMMVLGTDLVVSSAPGEKAGAASATSETATELGFALGIAVIGSTAAAVYRYTLGKTLPVDVPPETAILATDSLGGALAAAAELSGTSGAILVRAAQDAFSTALDVNAVIGAVILLGTAVFTAVFLRPPTVRDGAVEESGANPGPG